MLGIIIINFNQYQKTIDCIRSIPGSFRGEYKIYLIDNASSNGSVAILSELYKNRPEIELIASPTNLGYARGNNLGLARARMDGCGAALISNNDILYKEDAIRLLVETLKKTDYFLVGPLVRAINGQVMKTTQKNPPGIFRYLLDQTILGRLVPEKYKLLNVAGTDGLSEVYWVSGCSFIVDVKRFEQIGFFDPETFLYFEEFILSKKAARANLKIGFQPAAEVVHYHGASVGKRDIVVQLENWKSEHYFLKKYERLPLPWLFVVWILRTLFVFICWGKDGFIREVGYFFRESLKVLTVSYPLK